MPVADSHGLVAAARDVYEVLCAAEGGQGGLVDLQGLTSLDDSLAWDDALASLRNKVANPNSGVPAVLPLDGSALLLVYRRDVLEAMGTPVPRTWEALAAWADAYAAAPTPGAPLHPLCATPAPPACDGYDLFEAIWHSLAQSYGLDQGVYWRPDTLQPLASSPAFAAAVQLFQRLWRHALPPAAGQCGPAHPGLRGGECALVVAGFEQIKAAARGNASEGAGAGAAVGPGAFGVAQLPGSAVVLDRAGGAQLVPCSVAVCPYGTWDGEERVNLAPFVPSSLVVAAVNRRASASSQLLAWHTISHLFQYNSSQELVMAPGSGLAPFRASHFGASARAAWAAAGYDGGLLGRGLDALLAALQHPNLAWGLAMAGGGYYRSAIAALLASTAPRNASEALSEKQLLAELTALQQRLELHYSAPGSLAAGYRAFIVPGTTTSNNGPAAPVEPDPPASPEGKTWGAGHKAGLAVALVVGSVLLLLLALYLGHRGRWGAGCLPRKRLSWRSDAPGVSPATTLLVTDIEGSTTLWEELPELVMGNALQEHHRCLRRVLVRHRGYESATEGDSFVLAFFCPQAALAFALEAQAELLEADWPNELLLKTACAPTYSTIPAGFPFKRQATLESVFSKMNIRQNAYTSGGPNPSPLPSTPHLTGQGALSRLTSFGHIRGAGGGGQSPMPMARQRTTPLGRRERASIDMGSLQAFTGPAAGDGVAVSIAIPTPPSAAAVEAAALDLVSDLPLSPSRSRPSTGIDQRSPLSQSHMTAGSNTPDLMEDEKPPLRRSDPNSARGPVAPASDAFRSVPLSLLPPGTCARAGAADSPSPHPGSAWPHPQGLSRGLTDLQSGMSVPVSAAPTAPSSRPSGDAERTTHGTSTLSSGGWAVIHGGEAVMQLDEQASGRGGPGTGAGPGLAFASVRGRMTGSGVGMADNAAVNAEAVDAAAITAPGLAREPSGCGASPGGGKGWTSPEGDGQPPAPSRPSEGGSEPLPKLLMPSRPSCGVLIRARTARHSKGGMTPLPAGSGAGQPSPMPSAPYNALSGAFASGAPAMAPTWETCTWEQALRAVVTTCEEGTMGDRKRRLLWRGLRVRMGLNTGVFSESEVTHNRASARTVYSGECAAIVRAVADSAQGGMVLISESTAAALEGSGGVGSPLDALLVALGRYRIQHRDLALLLFAATTPELAPRLAVLPPPRNLPVVGLPVYQAPVGRAAVAVLSFPDAPTLFDWDVGITALALAMAERVIEEQLCSHRGYLVRKERDLSGYLAAFASPLDAARWALSCRDLLSSVVDWPQVILEHELCREGALCTAYPMGAYHTGPFSAGPPSSRGGGTRAALAALLSGSGSGPLPSPLLGKTPTLPSGAMSHALTASCDTGPLFGTAHGALAAAGGSNTPTGKDGEESTLLHRDTTMSVAGSSQPSYRMVRAASTSLDMEPTLSIAHMRQGSALSPGSPAGTSGGAPGAVAVPGQGPRAGAFLRSGSRLGSSSFWQQRQLTMGREGRPSREQPPREEVRSGRALASPSEGGGAGTGSGAASGPPAALQPPPRSFGSRQPPMQSPPASSGSKPSALGLALGTKMAALSSRWRATAGGYLEGMVSAGRSVTGSGPNALPVAAATATGYNRAESGRVESRLHGAMTATSALGSGPNPAGSPPAASTPTRPHTVGGAGVQLPAPWDGPSPREAGDPGADSPPTSPRNLVVKTALQWATSDEMGLDDGGDMFSVHLGGMDGLGPFTRGPGASNSGACALPNGVPMGGEGEAAEPVRLRGPRLRIGLDCGVVEWSISASHRCLTYSGPPVASSERLCSNAGAGQILASYDMVREIQRMQSAVVNGADLDADSRQTPDADSDAELCGALNTGRAAAMRGAISFRGPAIMGAPVAPHTGRAGLASAKHRRQQVFALRFTLDWDEAMRDLDQLQPTAPMVPAGAPSPHTVRMSPFSTPWATWASAARFTRKRVSHAGPAAAAAAAAALADYRRSRDWRHSFDVGAFASTPLGTAQGAFSGTPQAHAGPAGAQAGGGGGGAMGPSASAQQLAGAVSLPLPPGLMVQGACAARAPNVGELLRASGAGASSRVFASTGPLAASSVAGALPHVSEGLAVHTGASRPGTGNNSPSVPSLHATLRTSPPAPVVLAGRGAALEPHTPAPPGSSANSPPGSLGAAYRWMMQNNQHGSGSGSGFAAGAGAGSGFRNGAGAGTGSGGGPSVSALGGRALPEPTASGEHGAGDTLTVPLPSGSVLGGGEDAYSLSLRHNLQKAGTSNLSSALFVGGPADVSSDAQTFADNRVIGGDMLTDYSAGYRGHSHRDAIFGVSGFASGLAWSQTPAIPEMAELGAAPGTNSRGGCPDVSIGAVSHLSAATGTGGTGGTSGTGGGGAVSSGGSGASGTLQQALRQHRAAGRMMRQSEAMAERMQLRRIMGEQTPHLHPSLASRWPGGGASTGGGLGLSFGRGSTEASGSGPSMHTAPGAAPWRPSSQYANPTPTGPQAVPGRGSSSALAVPGPARTVSLPAQNEWPSVVAAAASQDYGSRSSVRPATAGLSASGAARARAGELSSAGSNASGPHSSASNNTVVGGGGHSSGANAVGHAAAAGSVLTGGRVALATAAELSTVSAARVAVAAASSLYSPSRPLPASGAAPFASGVVSGPGGSGMGPAVQHQSRASSTTPTELLSTHASQPSPHPLHSGLTVAMWAGSTQVSTDAGAGGGEEEEDVAALLGPLGGGGKGGRGAPAPAGPMWTGASIHTRATATGIGSGPALRPPSGARRAAASAEDMYAVQASSTAVRKQQEEFGGTFALADRRSAHERLGSIAAAAGSASSGPGGGWWAAHTGQNSSSGGGQSGKRPVAVRQLPMPALAEAPVAGAGGSPSLHARRSGVSGLGVLSSGTGGELTGESLGMSSDLEDSRASVTPPLGWRTGVHPPGPT
ncbi:hypothetical protein HYH03_008153 [Edaphochlamys debaryana]|uniref:Guanylate cyclase domain-containing protein n=1 Tax=Edaphochlamys debaryana TaxID=47281 RepID=A0A835Y0H8_9CHLO|nr:hypothetical protein HYH03_008153 [Edaphochlamys debaryana]|eukprot:KAG2493636.1 hypothetical protein HYH03_008153 [Edaphochlamys debaryana]